MAPERRAASSIHRHLFLHACGLAVAVASVADVGRLREGPGSGLWAAVAVDFTAAPLRELRAEATLQVVTHPLLDRHFVLQNGTQIPNPIHDAAWGSLGDLGAEHVRFQPWFPYPHKAVPELDPPRFWRRTSWNFTSFLPQLKDFMRQTADKGHSVVWNFGTIPCWMFNFADCRYPKDVNKADFAYGVQGVRLLLRDPSARTLAEYFGRLMSFLTRGEMTDEHGDVHRGGPRYNLSKSRGHIFEFLNEGEHHYTPAEHVHDYDVVVPEIISNVGSGPGDAPAFMGVGGCQNGNWAWWFMGNCSKWLPVFLDHSRHLNTNAPLDYASVHYYASASNRSDVATYTRGFFSSADAWIHAMDDNLRIRDRLSPSTKIAITELGTLFADDMAHKFGRDGGLPDLYFNAAGAFYAYVYAQMSLRDVEFMCFSQLIGSPVIPEWNIHDMQFPSASLLSWETGFGNAKYWVLKLLIDHLRKGDAIYKATVSPSSRQIPRRQVMCEAVGHWIFPGEVTLACEGKDSTISEIWADAGLAPSGNCGAFKPSRVCSSHFLTTAWATTKCKGQRSCTLGMNDVMLNGISCPLKVLGHQIDPHDIRLTVQARCSGSLGGYTSADYGGASVFALGYASAYVRKVLLVNKEAQEVRIALDSAGLGGETTAYIVDPHSVQRSAQQGIRMERWRRNSTSSVMEVALQPFAVVVAESDVQHTGPGSSQMAFV